MRAPRRTDDREVAEVLGALVALGPGATTLRVVEKMGLRPGSTNRVRSVLWALEGAGVVALAFMDVRRPADPEPEPTAWVALTAAQVALENATLALTAAQEAVKAALAKQRKPAPRAAHPTPPRPQ